jgi:hypothetical protein
MRSLLRSRVRSLMRTAAVIALVGITAWGQDAKEQQLPPAVANLVDLARTAPPELFADAIARLIEDGKLPAGEARIDLLKEAFAAAARAQEPFRLKPVPGLPADSRAVFRSKASELELDSLSLRLRLLKLLSKSELEEAPALFATVAHPSVERTPCEDPLIPDASAYMEMAGLVARTNPQVDLLRSALDGAKSPAEVAAFVNAILPLTFEPEQWQALLGALAAKMEAVMPDYRSFTISVASMREPFETLTMRAADKGYDASVLPRAFRRFLTNQMSGPRCDEDFGDARPLVEWFNASFRGTLDPIADSEIEPSQRLGTFQAESYFAAPDAKQVADEFAKLKANPAAPATDFLRDFSAWVPTGSDIDVFHQRMAVLRGLLDILPQGPERDQAIAQCLNVLATSRVERLFPAEWLLQVKALVGAAGSDSARLTDAFRASGDPGLVLFASF